MTNHNTKVVLRQLFQPLGLLRTGNWVGPVGVLL